MTESITRSTSAPWSRKYSATVNATKPARIRRGAGWSDGEVTGAGGEQGEAGRFQVVDQDAAGEDVAGGAVDGRRPQGRGELLLLGCRGRAPGGPEGVGGQSGDPVDLVGQGPAGVAHSARVTGQGLLLGGPEVGAGGPQALHGVGMVAGGAVEGPRGQ